MANQFCNILTPAEQYIPTVLVLVNMVSENIRINNLPLTTEERTQQIVNSIGLSVFGGLASYLLLHVSKDVSCNYIK